MIPNIKSITAVIISILIVKFDIVELSTLKSLNDSALLTSQPRPFIIGYKTFSKR